jgi:heavy metal-binding protein
MKTSRPGVLAVLALSVLGSSLTAPSSFPRAQAQGPISHICPMDPDVVEDKPGTCPVCKMTLQPVRIETAMACPVHPQLRIYDKPGRCPVDKRELIPVVVNHFWDCGEKPERFYAEPGKCPDGRPREEKRVVRAHGDHNPRHGGQFFMAEDKWHHLEATYQRGGPLRIYLYDNFTKDLAGNDVRAIAGRAVVLDANLASIESVPLTPSRDGRTLEARLTKAALPLRVQARVKFKEATREQPFDFTFQSFTLASTTPAPPVRPGGSAGRVTPPVQPPPAQVPPPPASQTGTALPNTSGELLRLLELHRGEVKSFIDEGNLGMVYVPAMLAKDVSLALADHGGELRGDQVVPLTLAVKRLVVAAWRLDQYGDLGDRERLTSVYADFAGAVADIEAAYAAR